MAEKQKSIGGVWIKHGKEDDYLSIKFDEDIKAGTWFTAFKNGYKKDGDKQPNYRIMPPLPPRGEQQSQQSSGQSKQRYQAGDEPF